MRDTPDLGHKGGEVRDCFTLSPWPLAAPQHSLGPRTGPPCLCGGPEPPFLSTPAGLDPPAPRALGSLRDLGGTPDRCAPGRGEHAPVRPCTGLFAGHEVLEMQHLESSSTWQRTERAGGVEGTGTPQGTLRPPSWPLLRLHKHWMPPAHCVPGHVSPAAWAPVAAGPDLSLNVLRPSLVRHREPAPRGHRPTEAPHGRTHSTFPMSRSGWVLLHSGPWPR